MADHVTPTGADVATTGSTPNEPERPPAPAPDQREYALVPLDRIRLHPLNLRRELRELDELADSIRQNGLVEPVVLVPDPEPAEDGSERFLLVAGHRRHAACVMARHDPVESIVRHDLDGDGAQVLAMLTENGPRDDLTPIEEARGYQLALDLNHLSPAKLAKRLGKARDKITSRIALTRLPDHVQEQVHARQLGLQDAETLCEFANDPEIVESLLATVGTTHFGFRIEQERRRRELASRIAGTRKQLLAAGARIIETPPDYPWHSTAKPVTRFVDPAAEPGVDGGPVPFTPEAHAAACSFHAVFVSPRDATAQYVCTNPEEAGHVSVLQRPGPPSPSPGGSGGPDTTPEVDVVAAEAQRLQAVEETNLREAEEQQRQRVEAERREALEVAGRLRHGFLATLVRRSGKAHLQAVLKLLLVEHFQAWLDEADPETVQELAGLIDARLPEQAEGTSGDDHWADIETSLRAALDSRRSPEAMAGALLALVAHDREWALTCGHGWSDPVCRRYLDWLVGQGYEPTEIEAELLQRAVDDDAA
jgi:ParB/RepB/Spo0J family partition protein